jgi:SSS family solute:Na+ symporter/sodium/pantothenate symporter
MAIVAIILFASGWTWLSGGFSEAMTAVSPDYAAVVNPHSDLYGSVFAVFVSAFVVTFALMMQPHILTKVLYLRHDRDVRRFLVTTLVTGAIFSLCLFVGFYARFAGVDPGAGGQDQVVTQYVLSAFGDTLGGQLLSTTVLVALLAAGMSTLDGILVALSAMVTHDIYLRLRPGRAEAGLRVSRWVLVGVGLVAFVIALDPPGRVPAMSRGQQGPDTGQLAPSSGRQPGNDAAQNVTAWLPSSSTDWP